MLWGGGQEGREKGGFLLAFKHHNMLIPGAGIQTKYRLHTFGHKIPNYPLVLSQTLFKLQTYTWVCERIYACGYVLRDSISVNNIKACSLIGMIIIYLMGPM